jgi:HTH-type transcriptional regulator/antitoxin HigA
MIMNALQYRVSKAAADKLRDAIATAERAPRRASKAAVVAITGLRSQLTDIERELAQYDRIARGDAELCGSLDDLGGLLTHARIARGWTQQQLGERLGVSRQQIHRYEASAYAQASLSTVRFVAQVLGVTSTVSLELVRLPELSEDLRAAFQFATDSSQPRTRARTRRPPADVSPRRARSRHRA